MSWLVLAACGFSIGALVLAFVAAWGFARSVPPQPRYRRTVHPFDGVDSQPEVDSTPFPNLLRK